MRLMVRAKRGGAVLAACFERERKGCCVAGAVERQRQRREGALPLLRLLQVLLLPLQSPRLALGIVWCGGRAGCGLNKMGVRVVWAPLWL